MSEKNVKIGFKVDGVDGYITDLNELSRVLNNADTSTKKLSNSQDKSEKSTKKLKKETDELSKSNKKAASTTNELSSNLSNIPGPLGQVGSGLKTARSAVDGLSSAFKILIANPILLTLTLVAGALSILSAAFFSTQDGADAASRAGAAFRATLDQVRDLVLESARDIESLTKTVNAFFSTVGAAKLAFGFRDEAQDAADLTGELQRIREEQRKLRVERAETNKEISAARLNARDENLTLEERTTLLEEAAAKEEEILQKELLLEKQRLTALEALAAQSDSDLETKDEIADAQVKIAELEEKSNNRRKAVSEEVRRLQNEARVQSENDAKAEQAERDAAAADTEAKAREAAALAEAQDRIEKQLRLERLEGEDKEIQAAKDRAEERLKTAEGNAELTKLIQTQLEDELDGIRKKYDQKEIDENRVKEETIQGLINQSIDNQLEDRFRQAEEELRIQEEALIEKLRAEGATEEQIQQVRDNFKKKREKLAKEESDYNIDLAKKEKDEKLKALSSTFSSISSLVGEQTAAGKAAAVAAATIDTYVAANNALANTPLPPPFPAIAAGVAIASGLKSVQEILKVKTPGGNKGVGTVPTITQPSIPTFTGPELPEDAGATITPGNLGQNQPIRAYVIADEVTNSQNANQQIENLIRL